MDLKAGRGWHSRPHPSHRTGGQVQSTGDRRSGRVCDAWSPQRLWQAMNEASGQAEPSAERRWVDGRIWSGTDLSRSELNPASCSLRSMLCGRAMGGAGRGEGID